MTNKPGEMALKAMKEANNKLVQFKTPNIPQKRKSKMEILNEEQYIEEMGKIIQRDFFPDLEKLKAQNQYLDAVEKNDVIKLRELYAKYSGRRPNDTSDRCESPATFETPIRDPDSIRSNQSKSSTSSKRSNSSQSSKCPSEKHSLDSYLDSYTSEDNNSFQEIIEAADFKLRQKFAVLYEAEKTQAIKMEKVLALPTIEKQFDAIEGSKLVDTWTYTNRNYIMYVPDGVPLTKEEEVEMAKRKMKIIHNNTRLQKNPFDDKQNKETISELAKTQANKLIGRIGVDGDILNGDSSSQVRGFNFVKTPSPCPGVQDSPMMTWGEIEGTPFRLDGSDTPIRPSSIGPSFRIAETSRRENIGLELAEKAGERMRGQKAKAIEAARRNIATPHMRSSMERLATMSPAAKRLASMKFGLK